MESTQDELAHKRLDEFSSRLSRTEAIVESIANDISRLTSDISIIVQAQTTNSRTNWATLAGWAAVIISIIALFGGYAGSVVSRDIDRVQNEIHEIEVIDRRHEAEGHTGLRERMRHIEEDIEKLYGKTEWCKEG